MAQVKLLNPQMEEVSYEILTDQAQPTQAGGIGHPGGTLEQILKSLSTFRVKERLNSVAKETSFIFVSEHEEGAPLHFIRPANYPNLPKGSERDLAWSFLDTNILNSSATLIMTRPFEGRTLETLIQQHIEILQGLQERHEPVVKGKGVPIWSIVAYAQKRNLTPEQIAQIWDYYISPVEVRAALEYYKRYPEQIESNLEAAEDVNQDGT